MKILLDSSYLLPLIKIEIEKIPNDLLSNLLSVHSNEYYYSSLSTFELTAKGLKLSSQEKRITTKDIRIGIDALQQDTRLTEISYIDNPLIIDLASQFRSIHKDTIDCLIFSTAICNCDCIITMDKSFYKQISKNLEIIKEIRKINLNFKFWFNALSDEIKTLGYEK